MALEDVRVVVVEHRLNGRMPMSGAEVGQLRADKYLIARPDPKFLWPHSYVYARAALKNLP